MSGIWSSARAPASGTVIYRQEWCKPGVHRQMFSKCKLSLIMPFTSNPSVPFKWTLMPRRWCCFSILWLPWLALTAITWSVAHHVGSCSEAVIRSCGWQLSQWVWSAKWVQSQHTTSGHHGHICVVVEYNSNFFPAAAYMYYAVNKMLTITWAPSCYFAPLLYVPCFSIFSQHSFRYCLVIPLLV